MKRLAGTKGPGVLTIWLRQSASKVDIPFFLNCKAVAARASAAKISSAFSNLLAARPISLALTNSGDSHAVKAPSACELHAIALPAAWSPKTKKGKQSEDSPKPTNSSKPPATKPSFSPTSDHGDQLGALEKFQEKGQALAKSKRS